MNDDQFKEFLKSKNYLYKVAKKSDYDFETYLGDTLHNVYYIEDYTFSRNGLSHICESGIPLKLMLLDILKDCRSIGYNFKFVDSSEISTELLNLFADKKFMSVAQIFHKYLDKSYSSKELVLKSFEKNVMFEWNLVMDYFESKIG